MARHRNVRKLALHPPLPRRAIVWFPQFEDVAIDTFRGRHDPLASQIDAHVALVFPFPCNLSVMQLASHTRRIVAKWPHLPVVFRDVESLLDEFILLMARERSEALIALHDALYSGVLKDFLRKEMQYVPHITIARAGSPEAFPAVFEEAELEFGRGRAREWRTVLRELAIVTWHPDGKITVDQTVPLNTD
ncbi:MAG TPA: 2'-5' RNA ligase family protein [Usitatibacteraceae bacterium]